MILFFYRLNPLKLRLSFRDDIPCNFKRSLSVFKRFLVSRLLVVIMCRSFICFALSLSRDDARRSFGAYPAVPVACPFMPFGCLPDASRQSRVQHKSQTARHQ